MLSSGANVIIWDKMLSSGANVIMVNVFIEPKIYVTRQRITVAPFSVLYSG
jgi:hypothetical protein